MRRFIRNPVRAPLALFFLPCLALAQHGQVDLKAPDSLKNPESVAAGAKLYATSCGGCHGPEGIGGRGPNLIKRLARNIPDGELFATLRNGLPGTDMPPTSLSDDDTWKLAGYLRSISGPANQAVVPGDPANGEAVFNKAGCAGCHAILGKGSRMGPDLSNIGANKPLAAIRDALVPSKTDPSKNYQLQGAEGVKVTMKDGSTLQGIARNRSNYSLQIVDQKGDLHLVSMDKVRELQVKEGSPMPADYGQRLSATDMRDLLAYLARQSVRSAK